MKSLAFFDVLQTQQLVEPEVIHDLAMDSLAVAAMEDFRAHKAHSVDSQASASSARDALHNSGLHYHLVLDHAQDFVGIIDDQRLSGEAMQLKRAELGVPVSELTVRDLMLPRHQIKAVDLAQISRARVGDVVESLSQQGKSYVLVVERDEQKICGLMAAKDIARRLHSTLSIATRPTFVDIFTAVKAH